MTLNILSGDGSGIIKIIAIPTIAVLIKYPIAIDINVNNFLIRYI